VRIITQDDDAASFVDEVRLFVSGIIRLCHPAEFFLIKTDNWIGPNWLRFEGKALGLIGSWSGERSKHLTVPPFVPHGVLWERRYKAPDYKQVPIRRIVHVKTTSDSGRTRFMHEVAPGASVVWYSGKSSANKRAAIMAYVLSGDSYWPWYTGWASAKDLWRIVKLAGATTEEIAAVRSHAEASGLQRLDSAKR
jgi:hypothetical protein